MPITYNIFSSGGDVGLVKLSTKTDTYIKGITAGSGTEITDNTDYVSISNTQNQTISVAANSADAQIAIPAGYRISYIDIINTASTAPTGGVNFGTDTTSASNAVVSAVSVAASNTTTVADSDILKKFFSTASPTSIYVSAVTSWNSADLDIFLGLQKNT